MLKALLSILVLIVAKPRPELLVNDFEADTYAPWTATGDAFGTGPAGGALPNQQQVSNFQGKRLVNSYLNGDKSTGTLTSPPIKLERKYLNFLIGGGAHEGEIGINLLIDDKIVRTATGAEDERLDWSTWNIAELQGKTATFQIVDKATGGWGHINLDQIVQSDTPRAVLQTVDTTTLYNETHRPQFHFTAKKNWINDPNGLVFYAGEYHLFFQYNPFGTKWGNMTWGHAVSPDLVHWTELPNALAPDRLGTMFSGSAVIDWNNTAGFGKEALVAMYTAAGGTSPESKGQPFTQCLAYSTDKGRTFTKFDKNPVLPHIVGGNRDPRLIRHEPSKSWILALYLDKSDFALFSSPDLKSWTKLQTLTLPGCDECPDFFPMKIEGEDKTKWVFTAANGKYLVGDFDGKKFTPDNPTPAPADFGRNYYAVQTWCDAPDGRRIQIAWMRNGQYPKMPFNGQMSFPTELRLKRVNDTLRLHRTPIKEIESLRVKTHSEKDLPALTADLLDIRADFPADADFTLTLRGHFITWSARDHKLTCLGSPATVAPLNNRIGLQILLDRTTIEVFSNDGAAAFTTCVLPKPNAPTLSVQGKPTTLQIHELKSAWPKL